MHTLLSGILMECCLIDSYIQSFHRISIHNKPHKPAFPLKLEATSFLLIRTFCVYIFTIITMYIPAEE